MLKKLIDSMVKMEEHGMISMRTTLDTGRYIVVADLMPLSTTYGIKYAFNIMNNRIYCYTLKDSTDKEVVLSLAAVYPYNNDCFNFIYQYIKEKDSICTCNDSILNSAKKMVCAEAGSVAWSKNVEKLIDDSFKENPRSLLYFEANKDGYKNAETVFV